MKQKEFGLHVTENEYQGLLFPGGVQSFVRFFFFFKDIPLKCMKLFSHFNYRYIFKNEVIDLTVFFFLNIIVVM